MPSRRSSSRVQKIYMHDYGNGDVRLVNSPVNDMRDNALLPKTGPDDPQTWREHVYGPKTRAGLSMDEAFHDMRRAWEVTTGERVDPNRVLCPICVDTLRYPHSLECGHEVCEACRDKWKQFGVSTDVCPSCMDPRDHGVDTLLKTGITLSVRAEHALPEEREQSWGSASGCLYQAAEKDPESPTILTALAVALYHHGESTAALGVLQAALDLDPSFSMAHYYRGVIHSGHGDNATAKQAYADAIEEDPENAKAYHDLGCLLHRALDKGSMNRAHDAFQEAMELDSKMIKAMHSRGAIQLQQGDTAGALQRFASVRSEASTPSGMFE